MTTPRPSEHERAAGAGRAWPRLQRLVRGIRAGARQPPPPARALVESLEPRMLLSAELGLGLDLPRDGQHDDAVAANDAVAIELGQLAGDETPAAGLDLDDLDALWQGDAGAAAREIVFVDTGIDDHEALLADFLAARDGVSVQVVLLDTGEDGIMQMDRALRDASGLQAVHVLSHGDAGGLQLGDTWLDADALARHADTLAGWTDAFAPGGDLLLYGCDLAASAAGRALVDGLAALTGADVGASDDLTGSSALGGDWTLEYAAGTLDTVVDVAAAGAESWHGVLGQITVTTTVDEFDGIIASLFDLLGGPGGTGVSLREAIIAANNDPDADTIFLGEGVYTLTRSGSGDTGGDLDIRDDLTIIGLSPDLTVIDGNGIDRVFDVAGSNITVSFANLRIEGGATSGTSGNDGAGLLINQGAGTPDVSLSNVWFRDNHAASSGDEGGAIFNSGNLSIENSLFENNSAGKGGAIYNQAVGTLSMSNVTLSGNSATESEGGGLANFGTATLAHVTIASNSATTQGGGLFNNGTLNLSNSILAGNSAGGTGPDLFGALASSSNNLFGDDSGGSGYDASDKRNADADLGALTDNGGSLRTHALGGASEAIDAATTDSAGTPDQRGLVRDDGSPDMGAYEAGASTFAQTLYLDGWGDGRDVPRGALKTTAPDDPTLGNFDPGRDGDDGLTIARGGSGIGETDEDKHQIWLSDLTGLTLDGPVSLDLWTAMSSFHTSDGGSVTAFLVDSNLDGSDLTELASATITRADWDAANSADWIADTFVFGSVSHTLAADRLLGVKLVVDGSADRDMWFAFDSASHPAALNFTAGTAHYLDRFDAHDSYTGDDGTLSWSNDWQEVNEADSAASGNVQVLDIYTGDGGGNVELFVAKDKGAWREADLSGAGSATLSFDYARSGLEADDYLVVYIQSGGGTGGSVVGDAPGTWDEIARFGGPGTDPAYLGAEIDISPYIGTDTRILFFAEGATHGNDRIMVDNVRIDLFEAGAANVAPEADAAAGGPYAIAEGDTLALDGSASSDMDGTVTAWAWDIGNDGSFEKSGETTTFSWAELVAAGLDDDGSHDVALRVTDDDGASHTVVFQVEVSNVAPVLTATGLATIEGGDLFTLNLSAVDPGDDTITSYIVHWGDGTSSTETYTGATTVATHSYATAGVTYSITIAAIDEDGTHSSSDLVVGSYASGDGVFVFDGATGDPVSVFASSGGDLDRGYAPVLGPDGNFYVSGFASGNIVRYDVDGNYLGEFVAAGTLAPGIALDRPSGLAWGADGNLYVANYGENNILRFDADGIFIDEFGTGGSHMNGPSGLAFGADGDLYVASWNNGKLVTFDGASGGAAQLVVSGGLFQPEQIAFDTAGDLYIADSGSGQVLKWDGASLSTYFSHADLSVATGLTFGPDGKLYVASYGNDLVLRYDGTTAEVLVAAGAGGLDQPMHLGFAPDHQVTVQAPPVADAGGPYTIDEGSALALDGSASADADGTLVSYAWDVNNDGSFEKTGSTASFSWAELEALGILDDGSFDVALKVTDDSGLENTEVFTVTVDNVAPTLTAFGAAVDTTPEETEVEITFGELAAQGDEADVVDSVDAFVVDAVSSGSLRIGTSAGTATAWAAGTNDVIDATRKAWWTPATDAEGALAAFTVRARDDDGLVSATAVAVSVDVTGVNDQLTATNVTQTQAYTEGDASVALDDIVVSDPDAGEVVTATLTLADPSAGVLTTSGSASYTAGTGVWTITDTVANVNAALAAVAYTPAADYDQDTSIAVSIADGGEGGTVAVTGTITLDVTPVNDQLTATNVNQTQSYVEDGPSIDLDDIVVSDADSGEIVTATLTLADPLAGSLSTSGSATYTAGTGVWTITDTVANVNAALAAVSFTPAPSYNADTTVVVSIADGGEDGTVAVTGGINLNGSAVNSQLTATNVTQTQSYTEGDASVALDDIVVSDVDIGEVATATLTLADPAAGMLTTSGSASYTTGTGVWTITDTVANVNAALAAVAFTPAADYDQDTSIAVSIADGGEDGTVAVTGTITLDVTPVNDQLSATNVTQTQSYTEGDPSVALDDIVVSDPDTGDLVTATLTLADPAAGVLTTSGSAGYTAGTGVWTVTDTVANVNAALAAVAFTPAADYDQDTSIAVSIADGGEGGTVAVTGTITLDVTPVNDQLSATNVTQTQAYTEDDASVALDDIVVSDPDTGEVVTATLTLADPSAGVLTTSGSASYTAGTGVWTITDTVANVNAALAAVAFTPAADYDQDTSIAVSIADGGESGTVAVTGTITLDVTPANDNPTGGGALTATALDDNAGNVSLFSALTLGDVDSGENDLSVRITLGDPAAGTVVGGGFSDLGGGVYERSGLTVAQANAALQNAKFRPTDNSGPSGTFSTDIGVTVDDQGGGGPQTVLAPTTVTITRVNDQPGATNVDQTVSWNEDAASVALGDILVNDLDAGEVVTATLTLADPAAGALTTSGTASYTPGTGVWTITGTLGDVNAALAAASFVPAADYDLDTSIAVSVADSGSDGTVPVTGTIILDVTPGNDQLAATNLDQTRSFNEDAAAQALDDIVVSDVDSGEIVTATLTLADPSAGRLSTAGGGSYNAATGVWSHSGSIASVNAALAAVAFVPGANADTDTTIAVEIADGGEDGTSSVSGTITLDVTAVGDTPRAASVTTAVNTTSGLIVLDRHVDDGAEVTHLRISGIVNGTLTLADGVTAVANGDYIAVADGQAGLRFTPLADSIANGRFLVEASEDGVSVAAQSLKAVANVTVSAPPPPAPDPEPAPDTDDEEAAEAAESFITAQALADAEDAGADPEPTPESEPSPAAATAAPADDSSAPAAAPAADAEVPFDLAALVAPANGDGIAAAEGDVVVVAGDDAAEAAFFGVENVVDNERAASLPEAFSARALTAYFAGVYNTQPALSVDLAYAAGYLGNDDRPELLAALVSDTGFLDELDLVREDLEKVASVNQAFVGSTVALSTGLSVGYVVWLARGGLLLASMLSSMPAWRLVDPLPILASLKLDDEGGEGESLASLLEQNAAADANRDEPSGNRSDVA